jgi:ketosteroid isomerase-like protein
MSEENVEIVRRYYEAFASDGFDRWMEQFAEDVEYWPAAGELGGVGPIRGRKALRAYFQDWIDTFDEFWFELIELIDAGGDTVVTVERYGGRARLSGVETDQTEAEVFTIRDGKIAQCRECGTRDEALEAAGLSE